MCICACVWPVFQSFSFLEIILINIYCPCPGPRGTISLNTQSKLKGFQKLGIWLQFFRKCKRLVCVKSPDCFSFIVHHFGFDFPTAWAEISKLFFLASFRYRAEPPFQGLNIFFAVSEFVHPFGVSQGQFWYGKFWTGTHDDFLSRMACPWLFGGVKEWTHRWKVV